MDWNKEVSQRGKRVFWMCLGFGLLLLFMVLGPCNSHPAGASTRTAPAPVSFTAQAKPDVLQTTRGLLFSDIGHKRNGGCAVEWGWAAPASLTRVTDALGTEYAPGVGVQWCGNKARTKVTKLVFFSCYDQGGYYKFNGCKKSHGSTGYASLGLSTKYSYQLFLGIPGVYDYRNPSIVFSVYPNGVVAGTVYYDN
jgi:hypothetical protein